MEDQTVDELQKKAKKYLKDSRTIANLVQSSSSCARLDLSNHRLFYVTPELAEGGKNTNLRTLTLFQNVIREIPENILDRFVSLQALYLNKNRLERLPQDIGCLVNLRTLSVSQNRLIELPSSIGNLISLKSLCLYDNRLTSLPSTFSRLQKLESLEIERNLLKSLPTEIGNLVCLQSLEISNNLLTALPIGICKISLVRIDLSGNPCLATNDSSLTTKLEQLSVPSLLELAATYLACKTNYYYRQLISNPQPGISADLLEYLKTKAQICPQCYQPFYGKGALNVIVRTLVAKQSVFVKGSFCSIACGRLLTLKLPGIGSREQKEPI